MFAYFNNIFTPGMPPLVATPLSSRVYPALQAQSRKNFDPAGIEEVRQCTKSVLGFTGEFTDFQQSVG
jgi:hypothetical protein